MSGGHFNYIQYQIDIIYDGINQLVRNNKEPDEYGHVRNYSEETIEEFKKALDLLSKAAVYAQRIDWLVSGDDSEKAFHDRLKEELESLKTK